MDDVMNILPFGSYPLLRVGLGGPDRGDPARDFNGASEKALLEQAIPLAVERSTRPSAAGRYHLSGSNRETLVAGFDAVRADLSDLTSAVDQVGGTVRDLADIVSGSFDRLARVSERQLAQLTTISDVLANPMDTAGQERRRRGLRAYRTGLLTESREDLRAAVEKNVYDHVSWLVLGHIDLRLGEPRAAIEKYERAIRYASAESSRAVHAFALLGRARAEAEVGSYSEAVVSAQQARDLTDADRWDSDYELARTLVLAGDHPGAAEPLARALVQAPLAVSTLALAEEVGLPIVDAANIGLPAAHRLAQTAQDAARGALDAKSFEAFEFADALLSQVRVNAQFIKGAMTSIAAEKEEDARRVQKQKDNWDRQRKEWANRSKERVAAQERWDDLHFFLKWGVGIAAMIVWVKFGGPLLPSSGIGPLIAFIGLFLAPWAAIGFLTDLWPRPTDLDPFVGETPQLDPRFDRALLTLETISKEPLAGVELR